MSVFAHTTLHGYPTPIFGAIIRWCYLHLPFSYNAQPAIIIIISCFLPGPILGRQGSFFNTLAHQSRGPNMATLFVLVVVIDLFFLQNYGICVTWHLELIICTIFGMMLGSFRACFLLLSLSRQSPSCPVQFLEDPILAWLARKREEGRNIKKLPRRIKWEKCLAWHENGPNNKSTLARNNTNRI